jgi:hypothetical protein
MERNKEIIVVEVKIKKKQIKGQKKLELVQKINTDLSICPPQNIQESILRILFAYSENSKKEKYFQIIDMRLGLHESPKSLEEIGTEFNLTRERIRQIERKAIDFLKSFENIWLITENEIKKFEGNDNTIIKVEDLKVIPWFNTDIKLELILDYIFEKRLIANCFLVKINSNFYLSPISKNDLYNLKRKISPVFIGKNDKSVVEEKIKKTLHLNENNSLLAKRTTDLIFLLNEKCNYPLENLVKEVLNSSETPMHYKEICSKVVAIRNESPALKVSLNSVKNYLIRHNDIAPLKKGFYCVRKHLDMPEEEQKRLAKNAKNIILGNGNQIHALEICSKLRLKQSMDWILNAILLFEKPKGIQYLGRLVWTKEGTTTSRETIHSQVVKLLAKTGRPMSLKEIQAHVTIKNNMANAFLKDPIIKVQRSFYGLKT